MKTLRGLAIVLVIFVLPAGSWYYLQQGYNYRLNALQELEPKGQFERLALEQGKEDLFEEKVTLICLCGDASKEELATLDQIEEKYDSRGFQLIKLKSQDPDAQLLRSKYGTDKLILVDKDREFRSSYTFASEDIKEVVKHVAIVIPLPSRKKIKLKREG